MDTGNIIAFLKKFSFVRLIGTGIALAYTILWMFNKSYSEEED